MKTTRRYARAKAPLAAVALTLLGLFAPTGPSAAVLLDSFTDALPPNPRLTASAQPVLFVGNACDGDTCPPAEVVFNGTRVDEALQVGLPGVFGGMRHASVIDGDSGHDASVRIDPFGGGRLIVGPWSSDFMFVTLAWGDAAHQMNLALPVLGVDEFEVDVLSAGSGFEASFSLASYDALGDYDGSAGSRTITVTEPGVLRFPYRGMDHAGGFPFFHDVDAAFLSILFLPGPQEDIILGEFRVNMDTAVPAPASSWGRIKAGYRR